MTVTPSVFMFFVASQLLARVHSDPFVMHETRQATQWRQDSSSHSNPSTENEFQFKDEGGGIGITKDGNEFSFHYYTAPDGIRVLTRIETYPSARLAKKAFEQKIKEASSISERGPKRDKKGKYIGERVAFTIEKTAGEGQSQSFICWTLGSEIHWIQAKSLKRALAFEKTLNP